MNPYTVVTSRGLERILYANDLESAVHKAQGYYPSFKRVYESEDKIDYSINPYYDEGGIL